MANVHRAVLDVVRERTNIRNGLPPHISQFDTIGRVTAQDFEVDAITQAIKDCVATDHLVRWPADPDEEIDSKIIRLTLANERRLREWVRREAESGDVDTDLIGHLNTQLQTLDNDD